MCLCVYRSPSTLLLTHAPVLLEGPGTLNGRSIRPGALSNRISTTIRSNTALSRSAGAWIVSSEVLDASGYN